MKLHNLSLRDKATFSQYLALDNHELSVYAFENIYIWKELFEISWAIIEGSLCVFFRDKIGAFLYLSPLTNKLKPQVVPEVFKILDKFNANKEISRIENAEEKDLAFYRNFGLECLQKSSDYLCLRDDLVELKGDKFKSKRASFNYFVKNYNFEYRLFAKQDKTSCFKLYQDWASKRRKNNRDVLYCGMLDDSLKTIKILLNDYEKLNYIGRVVKVEKKIKAFSFGFKLNTQTFCILYEITDLSVKGLAQFIFRELCREMRDYKYINIMDDSGLENLKQVKLSYHPIRLVPAFIVKGK